MKMFSSILNYFKEVRIELKKVAWPTRSTTINYTLSVIAFSIATAVFLGGLDYFFSYILNNFIL